MISKDVRFVATAPVSLVTASGSDFSFDSFCSNAEPLLPASGRAISFVQPLRFESAERPVPGRMVIGLALSCVGFLEPAVLSERSVWPVSIRNVPPACAGKTPAADAPTGILKNSTTAKITAKTM